MTLTPMDAEAFKQDRLQDIIENRQHGAAELTRRALQCLADYSMICKATDREELVRELSAFAGQLQNARPSMAPLKNLLSVWTDSLTKIDADDNMEQLRLFAADHAHAVIKQSREAVDRIAEKVVNMIAPESTIITHSLSSTVIRSFELLREHRIKAIITESRPGYEGKLLAEKLAELEIPTHYITDAQLGLFTTQADFALVGADTVLADGSIVNKAGTLLLALAARQTGIPFYVCAETFKQSEQTRENIELEAVDTAELQPPNYDTLEPANIYFDITPTELITEWIVESSGDTTDL